MPTLHRQKNLFKLLYTCTSCDPVVTQCKRAPVVTQCKRAHLLSHSVSGRTCCHTVHVRTCLAAMKSAVTPNRSRRLAGKAFSSERKRSMMLTATKRVFSVMRRRWIIPVIQSTTSARMLSVICATKTQHCSVALTTLHCG